MVTYLITFLRETFGSSSFLLLTTTITFIFKAFLLGALIRFRGRSRMPHYLLVWLAIAIISMLIVESSWVIKFLQETLYPSISYTFFLFTIRLGWLFFILQYLAFAFFLGYLMYPQEAPPHTKHQWSSLLCAIILCSMQVWIILCSPYGHGSRSFFELQLYEFIYWYIGYTIIPVLFATLRAVRQKTLPKILTAQLKIFVGFIIIPHLLFELTLCNPFFAHYTSPQSLYPFLSLAKIIFNYGLYFSAKKIIGLRFLNMQDHVEAYYHSAFVHNFKHILTQLAHVTSITEIKHITRTFFTSTLTINADKAHIVLRFGDQQLGDHRLKAVSRAVEDMLKNPVYAQGVEHYLAKHKIIIRDELAFNHFYEPTPLQEFLIETMYTLDADLLVPISIQQGLVGYIIVEHNARQQSLFTAIDYDELTIFATYVGSVINLLEYGDINQLMKEKKRLSEELYHKHQEINHYKESIRSFLRATRERKIGILFYRNRHFSFGNQAAHEILGINPNFEQGHPLTQQLKKIALDAQQYKTNQTVITKDTLGNKLVLSAVTRIDEASTVITLYYPEIADTIQTQLELLKNPSDWDYVLYLETTQPGKLINNLIPGSSETLLNFKIMMLRAAFEKKAIMIDMPPEDIRATVEILHHISLRSDLHIVHVTVPETKQELALKLYGINHLYRSEDDHEQPLLQKLDGCGTLYIENIDLLSLETQNMLAEFIKYGYFKPLKSDKKIHSSVRIIVSSHQNLSAKVQAGLFSAMLFEEITATKLYLPPLSSLTEHELSNLINGYLEQSLSNNNLKNLLDLSERERARILSQRPISLHEFKSLVMHALQHKANKKNIPQETVLDHRTIITDPPIAQAVALGKQALKDPRLMALLWSKFPNQTHIASLLGVNRSSVNRRCKEYNLL